MKCERLLCLFLFALFPVYSLIAQTDQRLFLIPEILNGLDTSTNSLEGNITASNLIIQNLSLKVNSMQTTIETQQRQLQAESENSANWEATALQRSQKYEQTLQSLETSFNQLLTENQEKDSQILKLKETGAKQMKAIFIMGSVIVLVIIFFIVKLAVKIKTGGVLSLFKPVI